ncbi:helix-hairpin-helix domain-containing protein [Corynebacterium sp. YIM 101645]|uniref:Helix-hairpin-helix domain-containing protein n=1 Tax=Corynebacterium lemuris TaxID=1859292 RepID=A0ABT2FY81_9CORY|nr:helix-hairpin-helix domain-containing protein [Corynebacterium lemuris]MCS5480197.1 helix-hairpin-helix domain-containing protein [Corynebacterium lemuris]
MNPLNRLQDLTRPTGEEELLDVAYPTPRLHLTLRHAAFAALAVMLLAAGIVVLNSGGAESAGSAETELPVVGAAVPVAAEEDGGELVISVVGAVAQPGLAILAPGARVDDALHHAQPLPEADLRALNLAQRLSDGQQLVVPAVGEAAPEPEAASGGGGGGVSLNSASVTELTTLPGVGPATAAAIVAHREATGGFGSVEQLLEVKGIGPAKFESLRESVTL